MGAVVDLCDDDGAFMLQIDYAAVSIRTYPYNGVAVCTDESPCPRVTASQQTASQTGKRLFACLVADNAPEKNSPGAFRPTGATTE